MTIPPTKNSIPATPAGTRLSLFSGAVSSTLIVFILGFCSNVAQAQQAGKTFRIGYLDVSSASGSAVFVDAFLQELSRLGWVEGKNIAIEYRFAEGKPGPTSELAADLVRMKVDLIVATGMPPALAAKRATTVIAS